MRILLVAYDFAPSASPQSLRWIYLAREFVRCGHQVEVVTPDIGRRDAAAGSLPSLPAALKIHRVYPGPVSAVLFYRRRKPVPAPANHEHVSSSTGLPAGTDPTRLTQSVRWLLRPLTRLLLKEQDMIGLNWKGVLEAHAKGLFSRLLYPDHRAEWLPWARRRVRSVLGRFDPHVVVTSHEPPNSIALGLLAKEKGYVWVADLGDPILSSYTPPRWVRRAGRLEQRTCRSADLVTVTTAGTRDLLSERHGIPTERIEVIPQGFDGGEPRHAGPLPAFDPALLELVYTGSLYSFRSIEPLVDAVARLEGVRLTIASGQLPGYLGRALAEHPAKFRHLGFQPHLCAMAIQRSADVLVNIANDDPVQIPGKLFEYFHARKPVIHLTREGEDAVSRLLHASRIGWPTPAAWESVVARLRHAKDAKAAGRPLLEAPDWDSIESYRWDRLAERWLQRVAEIGADRRSGAEGTARA